MSEEVTREAAFLSSRYYNPVLTSATSVECVINILFTHSDLYKYSEALTVIGTLYMLDLISKQLRDELAKALKELYQD